MDVTIRDNPARSRYEMDVEGGVAFATYRADATTVAIDHTEVPAALRGRGIGDRLVRGVLEVVRRSGRKAAVGEKFLAVAVAVNGAAIGAGINYMFTDHYQRMARVHFGLRKLERTCGVEQVQSCFISIMAELRRRRKQRPAASEA